jgi:hypothetical protein
MPTHKPSHSGGLLLLLLLLLLMPTFMQVGHRPLRAQ